jgi:hypothetical protein
VGAEDGARGIEKLEIHIGTVDQRVIVEDLQAQRVLRPG